MTLKYYLPEFPICSQIIGLYVLISLQLVRFFKNKPLTSLTVENSDESIWPRPDRLGHSIRGFKQAHVVFEKNTGVTNVIREVSNNPNRIWLLSTSEQPVVNIGLRKVNPLRTN